ncbi:MAG: hypoxanthine phosphoribosyltransferase [Mycoplasma sp.]|nr:hypoxanthine phosphoribosyltransferase [Mycoplasma sp.]
MDNKNYEIIITSEQVVNKCKELAEWINKTFKKSSQFLIVGILKGALQFLFELTKYITIPYEIDYLSISSFKGEKKVLQKPEILLNLDIDYKGYDVLIVDEIIDTGLSLEVIINKMKLNNPKSINVMSFLKKNNHKPIIEPNIYGFSVEPNFYIGFGLDYKFKLRSLPYIAILKNNL